MQTLTALNINNINRDFNRINACHDQELNITFHTWRFESSSSETILLFTEYTNRMFTVRFIFIVSVYLGKRV